VCHAPVSFFVVVVAKLLLLLVMLLLLLVSLPVHLHFTVAPPSLGRQQFPELSSSATIQETETRDCPFSSVIVIIIIFLN
jgi:hypothetical protein